MDFQNALTKAAGLCSMGERCSSDIRNKLREWEVSDEEIRMVLDRLIKEKFIDEDRYCRFFVRDKFRFNKWGKRKIEYELKRKSIPQELISKSLEIIDEEEYFDSIVSILVQKLKQIKQKDKHKTRASLIRFAASRGFEADLIYKAVDRLL